ncbi:MAG TPA: phosphoenolpyruvate synthase [Polyangiaceae bacterium]|nr:phosphoenolpyruvate synthase [Polyangiaceae bacterium]
MKPSYVLPFDQVQLSDVPRVGGKNASLGELIRHLTASGVKVPDGFAVTADAFRAHLTENDLEPSIYGPLDRLDIRDVAALQGEAQRIRDRIRSAPLPRDLAAQILTFYEELSKKYGEDETDVAVRSSATAEDLPDASFAGQHETYLNIRGASRLLSAVRDCMASLFTDRAIVYRVERGFSHRSVALSVGVQKMVRSDLGSAGVIFTLDTETGFPDVALITAAYGLGELVVQGRVNPDEYWVHKPTLALGYRPIVRRELGEKALRLVYAAGGTREVREEPVPQADRRRFVLTADETLELAKAAVRIEDHYTRAAGHPVPMDIEWAKDGRSGELFIVQARPETVYASRQRPKLVFYRLREKTSVLLRGKSVGVGIGKGKARVVHSPAELGSFEDGEVLVAASTDPDWEPVLRRASAVVTDHGGRTCHAAIVSRELGIPCIVGTGVATATLHSGDLLTVSCAEGTEGRVYSGLLDFEKTEVAPADLPKPSVPVMLNVGNPESAFQVGQLPSAGVGLARLEFVISSHIGVHPMALVHPERVTDPGAVAAIRARTAAFSSPAEFFVDRLASGVAQIAAAFYPRPVIVRFSDFKTNEYASLTGGAAFEPKEDNPMIGFRGASRYYDERYREGFALECRAIRRVREEMGLENVVVMIPFCRTLEEARRVHQEMEKNGLRRGDKGLQVYVMCEIPNNVVLATDFAELFDGFSIGSNDLTQLTLGVDRDSELLAHIFNEEDPGVKRMIETVIAKAHEKGRKVGLCGQAPSDHPEFAAFLADAGIDSISVTADALPRVMEILKTRPARPA